MRRKIEAEAIINVRRIWKNVLPVLLIIMNLLFCLYARDILGKRNLISIRVKVHVREHIWISTLLQMDNFIRIALLFVRLLLNHRIIEMS